MKPFEHLRPGRHGLWALVACVVLALLVSPATAAPTEGSAATTTASPPHGIIMLNFDDTYKSTAALAYPVMSPKGYQGNVFISPAVVGKSNKMTEADLHLLDDAGWDVSSHGWSHVPPETLSDADLTAHLKDAHDWLVARGFVKGARHYTPPNGGCDARVLEQAVKYYQSIRMFYYLTDTCWLTPKGYTYKVVRAHDASITWDALKAEIDAVDSSGEVLLLNFHNIVTTTPIDNQTSLARFTQIMDYLSAHNKTQ